MSTPKQVSAPRSSSSLIPITLHPSSSSSHPYQRTYINGRNGAFYTLGYTRKVVEADGAGASTPSTTSSINSHSVPPIPELSSASKRRKAYHTPPSPNTTYISLQPRLEPILSRCLPQADSTSTHLHPYSRTHDLGNNRSSIPSPKEIALSYKREQEAARLKMDNVAAARIAAANKRKSRKRGGSKVPATKRRSASPSTFKERDSPSENDLAIGVEPASGTVSPVLGGPLPMKRTRSGVLAISTAVASVGGTIGLGSPLKAILNSEESPAPIAASLPKDEERLPKRSKLNNVSLPLSDNEITRRATTSPPSLPPLPASNPPNTFPLSHPSPLPRPVTQRLNSGPGASDMRRVVSTGSTTAGGGSGNRRESFGAESNTSQGSGRSRREVGIPERLRDYEMKVAT